MTRKIEPWSSRTSRPPEQGRIRTGIKGAKGAPVAIETFRFTSQDHEAIDQLAALYGGNPQPWDNRGKSEREVISERNEIPIYLPPDPLGGTPVYELWSKGGVQRRCDGETALQPQNTPDGVEMVEVPCVCTAREKLECKPITRLSVVLPDIRFGGTWRLEAHGWNAAAELPGMVDMIASLQERGMAKALLALERRTSTVAGQTKQYVVPVLRLAHTATELTEGAARVGALASVPELRSLPTGDLRHSDDNEVVEAEEMAEMHTLKRIAIMCGELGLSDEARLAICRRAAKNDELESSKDLTQVEANLILELLNNAQEGKVRITMIEGALAVGLV